MDQTAAGLTDADIIHFEYEDYSRLNKQIGMSLVRSAERYIPDLGSNLDFVEFATPLSNEYWVNSASGGNVGPEQTPAQFGPGRFFDCTAGIEGLFVVGPAPSAQAC